MKLLDVAIPSKPVSNPWNQGININQQGVHYGPLGSVHRRVALFMWLWWKLNRSTVWYPRSLMDTQGANVLIVATRTCQTSQGGTNTCSQCCIWVGFLDCMFCIVLPIRITEYQIPLKNAQADCNQRQLAGHGWGCWQLWPFVVFNLLERAIQSAHN